MSDTRALSDPAPARHRLMWMAAWITLAAMFVFVALRSPGFDDEITNIELIEHLGTVGTAQLMQHEDVHPPGGYLLNGILHDALGRWEWVRAASAMLYVLALAGFVRFFRREHGELAGWLALLVAGLSPAALIWCTSLRWYAYFVPVLLWSLTVPPQRDGWWYHIKPALGWVIMAHISYAALVLAPALVLWWRLHSPEPLLKQLRRSVPAWLVAALLFLPQAWIFFSVHSHNSEGQTTGPFKSLVGVGISLASNQGLFPLSLFGVASMLAWAGLYLLLTRATWRRESSGVAGLTFLTTVALFVLSGLAGKFRNLVLLVPLQAAMLAMGSPLIRASALAKALVGVIGVCSLAGIVNVIRHQDTTKNSWNLPVNAVVTSLRDMSRDCRSTPSIYTFDPVLARAIRVQEPRWQVANYFARFDKHALPTSDCTVVLHTYRGALSKAHHEAFLSAERSLGATAVRQAALGPDENASIKRRMDPDYPDHQVDVKWFLGPVDATALNNWVLSRP